MSEQLPEGKNVGLNALLGELSQRIHRSDAAVMDSASAAIIRLQAQVRARGKLLQDIFNHPDVEMPAELHHRIDRTLMYGTDTQPEQPPRLHEPTLAERIELQAALFRDGVALGRELETKPPNAKAQAPSAPQEKPR